MRAQDDSWDSSVARKEKLNRKQQHNISFGSGPSAGLCFSIKPAVAEQASDTEL